MSNYDMSFLLLLAVAAMLQTCIVILLIADDHRGWAAVAFVAAIGVNFLAVEGLYPL